MRSSSAAISCSAASRRRSCVASRKRWCSSHPPFERQNPIVLLTAQLPSGKVRHRLGRGAALDQGLQHGAPGNPEDVGGDAGQLDVGRLEELQEPVALGRLALHQRAAIAQQRVAALAERSSWQSAHGGPDRRSTWYPSHRSCDPARYDMPGIADDQVEIPFQHA